MSDRDERLTMGAVGSVFAVLNLQAGGAIAMWLSVKGEHLEVILTIAATLTVVAVFLFIGGRLTFSEMMRVLTFSGRLQPGAKSGEDE